MILTYTADIPEHEPESDDEEDDDDDDDDAVTYFDCLQRNVFSFKSIT